MISRLKCKKGSFRNIWQLQGNNVDMSMSPAHHTMIPQPFKLLTSTVALIYLPSGDSSFPQLWGQESRILISILEIWQIELSWQLLQRFHSRKIGYVQS